MGLHGLIQRCLYSILLLSKKLYFRINWLLYYYDYTIISYYNSEIWVFSIINILFAESGASVGNGAGE
jgi:hypothetical protein